MRCARSRILNSSGARSVLTPMSVAAWTVPIALRRSHIDRSMFVSTFYQQTVPNLKSSHPRQSGTINIGLSAVPLSPKSRNADPTRPLKSLPSRHRFRFCRQIHLSFCLPDLDSESLTIPDRLSQSFPHWCCFLVQLLHRLWWSDKTCPKWFDCSEGPEDLSPLHWTERSTR